MQCYNCKHEFCWMCLGDWRSHGSEYYECSRYDSIGAFFCKVTSVIGQNSSRYDSIGVYCIGMLNLPCDWSEKKTQNKFRFSYFLLNS